MRKGVTILCKVALVWALAAFPPPAAAGLSAGQTLGAANANELEGLLPPEVLDFYRKGEWSNAIADWPEGQMKWEKEFLEGAKQNAERLALSPEGGIIEKATGKRPERIIGFPFPTIDAGDPQAGVKILWNYFYQTYNLGNARANVDLTWLSRKGLDRRANLDSYALVYDGQKPKYVPENPQGFLMQILASVVSPQDLNGTVALTWRYRDSQKRDNVWMYVPALRRVRQLSPANRSDGFLGSDMSQDDGRFFDGKPEDFTWKLAGETEMYRLADPWSLRGEAKLTPLPEGGWRGHYAPGPFVGFEDPAWKGAPWAPVPAVLAKRKMWIVEGVPKDRYYLYGKLQLYIDKENFQGAWNRKFSWSGELLSIFTVLGYGNVELTAADGSKECFWGSEIVYNTAINLERDRATVTGFPLNGRNEARQDVRVKLDPALFDHQTLLQFGK